MRLSCRIVILNYNGRAILERCLPSIAEAARVSACGAKVTVLDNCSRDDSRAYVETHFPSVAWVDAPSNRIFCSYNALVESMTEDVALLLNNDIKVEPGFVDPLVRALEADPEVFFASPQTLNFESGAYEGGRAKWEFRAGLPWGTAVFPGYEKNIQTGGPTMQTGFGAFRRSMFRELGGFDDLYLPGTVEDADLCFRAYRRGWKGVYCPSSVVHHMGQTSFKKAFGLAGIARMNRRNLYLFTWKNLRSPGLWAQHLVLLLPRLLWDLLRGRWGFAAGFTDALGRLGQALKRRGADRTAAALSDEAIFRISQEL